jgi:collagenase-like PrtC family protease
MCVSYSGRAPLQLQSPGRNRGECVQPCRWQYEIRERGKEGYGAGGADCPRNIPLNAMDLN